MKKETILLLLLVFFFSFISSIYFSSALTNNEIGQLIASGLNNNVKLNDTLGNNSVYDLNQQYNPNPILNQSQFTGNQEINTQNKPVMNNVSGSSVRSAKTSVSNNGPASSVPTGKVVVSAADIDSIVVYNGSKNINFADDLKTKHNTGSSDVKTFWNPFSGSNNAGLTGHVVSVDKNVVTTDINGNQSDLPAYPSTPGTTSDVVAKKGFSLFGFLSKCLKSITGWSIIGIPNWAYDGSIENNYVWTAGYTPAALGVQHFKLSLSANMSVPNAVNGLVYNKGYYLGNNLTQWEPFNFQGTVIGNTAWLRTTGNDLAPKAMADITVDKNDSKDYSIFLAYSCLKLMNSDWNCNNGKWIIFVVPTGNVSYNQAVGSTPAMGYTSVADLNVSDIPSVLKQLNLTLAQFQPELDDAQVIAPQTDINSTVGQVETLPFYVTNLGNKHNITNLTFDFDIGQSSVAQVVAANIPSFLALNQTAQGSISVQFKQAGNYQFHLYLQPQLHEVDTSDNGLTFYANVSSNSTASVVTVNNSLVNTPNTTINYSIAEPYSYTPFYGNSSLYIISGTDKMRTVFGGYFNGTSINPTLRVNIKPQVTFEAISSAPFFNSIDISGSMLTGDRESVNYYVVIKNMNNSKNYTTPIMQSMYKYYYDPKTLIPDFQFCVDYTATVVLSGSSMETTDIIEPKPFNLCNPTIVLNDFKTKRLQKLDGDYVVVTGGFSSKYFEDTNVQYYINFTDPQSYYGSYITPIINSSQGFAVFKLQDIGLTRYVNYAAGETFPGKVVLVGAPTPRNNATFNKSASFVWNGWTVNQNLNTLFLLKDEKSYIYSSTPSYSYMPGSGSQSSLYQINYIQFPDYLGQDVKDQIAAETVTEYKIVDENTQAILYDNILNASNSNGNLKSLELSNWYSFNSRYGGSCGLTLNNFTSGHVYTFTTTVLSSNADKFVAAPPLSILYLDGFQTLVNNPILRTRFINLDNFPVSFDIGGGLSKSYVPSIKLWYGPKDMFPNLTSHTLQKQNNLRLISLDQLQAFPSAYSGESNFSKAYDLQTGLHITITPLSNYSGPSSRNQFNCQLGEFSLVCDRDTGGYYINYYDSQNGFLYSKVVSNMELLKEYRDN
ncbi:MAG: hypothetical protein WCK29_02175, partial [archaeon]